MTVNRRGVHALVAVVLLVLVTGCGSAGSSAADEAAASASAAPTVLRALDDYQVDLKLDDVRADAILLATRDEAGATLPIEDGGPTRVVFADDLAPRFSPDLWIWNIDTIEVR